MRSMALLLLLVGLAPAAQAQAVPVVAITGMNSAVPASGRIVFHAIREDQDIGTHVLNFRRDGVDLTVDIAVDLRVTAFGQTVYTYRHRATEIWRDNQILSVKADTDDNGQKLSMVATATESGLNVDAGGKQYVLPLGYVPTSHWNPAWLNAQGLINTASGEALHPVVKKQAVERIATATAQIEATRYTVTSPRQGEIWFDNSGHWVKGRFVASDGSVIDYVLQ